ncbi:hypothetical protein GCM10023231_23350 [Olivibacter ginsenosidimutans]|uniref:Probable sensor domain-containing protein n=1 Tax=Olivibacter ginsenosidimutans TaxID=1176537 RepID=A0ABP9BEV7_9SPHI
MISDTTYLGARMVSGALENYFKEHAYQSLDESHYLPAAIIEALIDASFWASLRKEEGYLPKISVALIPPDVATDPLRFATPVRLTPHHLVKLSPAVVQPSIHLGVWYTDNDVLIWGTIHDIPDSCLVLEVIEPGLLVIKHKRQEGYGKYVNIAVLKGDQVKLVDDRSLGLTEYPDLLASLLGKSLAIALDEPINVLVELAVAMRRHARGGLLLLVPPDQHQWKDSIVHPISYIIDPIYGGLSDLIQRYPMDRRRADWKSNILKIIDIIGGFTAIDGATIMTKNYEFLAFGAKVGRNQKNAQVPKVLLSEPIVGNEAEIVDPVKLGGTRHLAAAQFVHDQREAMALVASQDGVFTVFVWSAPTQIVHAHRIDVLLL